MSLTRLFELPKAAIIDDMRHVFLTGASGFVGSAALRHLIEHTDWLITCPVTMRHYGEQSRLMSIRADHPDRVHLVPCDLSMPFRPAMFARFGRVDYIWNIASESHVDRSLDDPTTFIRNNVELIMNVLEFARQVEPRVFMHMSTDEVFGPLYDDQAAHHEWSPIKPSNPYSASKAAQEAIAFSYWRAFGVPVVITNTMNLIGPAQHPEKFVPKVLRAISMNEVVPVHSSPTGESGSRCWIDVDQFASAWLYLTRELDAGQAAGTESLTYYPHMPRELQRFNIVGEKATNLEIVQMIGDAVGFMPQVEMVNFHTSRPGHDMHYGLDGTKLKEFGWTPRLSLRDSLAKIARWYQYNPDYLGLE